MENVLQDYLTYTLERGLNTPIFLRRVKRGLLLTAPPPERDERLADERLADERLADERLADERLADEGEPPPDAPA